MVGLDKAANTCGEISEGPGPIKVRRGGLKEVIVIEISFY
jgi:hypothetical protein